MTRAQFLNDLYRRLGGLSKEQAEQHLTYYAEMLADRMEEGMSEAEAVASMEDVDTIARRILQDEGLPAGGVQPPRAPDLPRVEPMTDAGGYTAPRPKRDWREPAKIVAWVLAVLVAGGMVFSRLTTRNGSSVAKEVDAGIPADISENDWAVQAIPEESETPEVSDGLNIGGVHIGPDGIYVDSEGNEVKIGPGGLYVNDGEHQVSISPGGLQIDGEEFWGEWSEWAQEEGYRYAGELYAVDAGGIEKIEIEWISGMVDIQSCDGGTIQFCEESSRELTDDIRLVYEVRDETLHISFWRSKQSGTSNVSKLLTVRVPESLVDELDVESVSSDISLNGLTAQSVDLSTTSGEVVLIDVSARELEVSTTSGSVDGNVDVREVDVETVSGDVYLYLYGAASELDVETISGDTALTLADCSGFTLEYETVSGDLYADDFQTSSPNSKGKYIAGDGSVKIDASSVSGDLTLLAG